MPWRTAVPPIATLPMPCHSHGNEHAELPIVLVVATDPRT